MGEQAIARRHIEMSCLQEDVGSLCLFCPLDLSYGKETLIGNARNGAAQCIKVKLQQRGSTIKNSNQQMHPAR